MSSLARRCTLPSRARSYEETGWWLRRLLGQVDVVDWAQPDDECQGGGAALLKREFCFLADVEGDLAQPALEREKFSEFRWISRDELEQLKEHCPPSDTVIYELVRKGLDLAGHPTH